MKPTAVSKHGVDERIREIKAPAGSPQHSLDELTNLTITQDDCCELTSPASCGEHSAWLVDPDFLDVRIVEEWLQCAIPGERCQEHTSDLIVPPIVLFTHETVVNDGSHTSCIRHGVDTRVEQGRAHARMKFIEHVDPCPSDNSTTVSRSAVVHQGQFTNCG